MSTSQWAPRNRLYALLSALRRQYNIHRMEDYEGDDSESEVGVSLIWRETISRIAVAMDLLVLYLRELFYNPAILRRR